MAQVRAATLTNYIDVARFVGLDPYAMLKRVRISPTMLDDPDGRLPRGAVNALLNLSAYEANCIGFGLMMAESRSLAHLGAISLALKHQETMRGVIEALARYGHLLGDTIEMTLQEREGDDIALVMGIVAGPNPLHRQAIEMAMGTLCRAFVAVSDGRWAPKAVHFTHAAPGDLAIHQRVFGAPLVFNSDFNGFMSDHAALDARYATTEADMARHAETYLDQLPSSGAPASPAMQVRGSLELLLPLGRATLDKVSENLGMPPRTLQRLLEKEGHSFGGLLNSARRELAVEYLKHSAHPVAEVARMIGYSTPSSFTRWFCAEFGVTPAAWRAGERFVPAAG